MRSSIVHPHSGRGHSRAFVSRSASRNSSTLSAFAGSSSTRASQQLVALDSSRKSNLVIMGLPGSGKTTLGRKLAESTSFPVIDVDNDHLETHWACSVADKLAELGDDGFLEAEGLALQALHLQRHIISLSGSNPMHHDGMRHISSTGLVIWLDVPHEDILGRMQRMKVERIIGQATNSLVDILKFRAGIYDKWFDLRLRIPSNATPEEIHEQALYELSKPVTTWT